jgi:hypothetical protein
MRLDEFNKKFDSLNQQVQSMKATRSKNPRPEPEAKPVVKSATSPEPKAELNWRTQKPTEWKYPDGTPLVGKRGLPVGWLNEVNEFIPLTYNAWNMKELRLTLMDNRYNTPLYK